MEGDRMTIRNRQTGKERYLVDEHLVVHDLQEVCSTCGMLDNDFCSNAFHLLRDKKKENSTHES